MCQNHYIIRNTNFNPSHLSNQEKWKLVNDIYLLEFQWYIDFGYNVFCRTIPVIKPDISQIIFRNIEDFVCGNLQNKDNLSIWQMILGMIPYVYKNLILPYSYSFITTLIINIQNNLCVLFIYIISYNLYSDILRHMVQFMTRFILELI